MNLPKHRKALDKMTAAEFLTYLAKCEKVPGFSRYKLLQARDAAILAAKAKKLKSPLYIVEPHEHGNGGWCGSEVLDVVSKAKLFSINPVRRYKGGDYSPSWGSKIRACKTSDPNGALYMWDHEGEHWVDGQGRALSGQEGKQEVSARKREQKKRAALFASAKAKLTPAERAVVFGDEV